MFKLFVLHSIQKPHIRLLSLAPFRHIQVMPGEETLGPFFMSMVFLNKSYICKDFQFKEIRFYCRIEIRFLYNKNRIHISQNIHNKKINVHIKSGHALNYSRLILLNTYLHFCLTLRLHNIRDTGFRHGRMFFVLNCTNKF